MDELAPIRMDNSNCTPKKQDANPSEGQEEQETPSSTKRNRIRLQKQDYETEKMKKLFASFTANTHTKLREQAGKNEMEIAAMKQTNMDTQNLLTKKTTPTQIMNDHITSSHFTAMTKPSEILFDRKPENWTEFEHHLLTETENPTIVWNQELTNFHLMDETTKKISFLEGYSNIPETTIGALWDDLQHAKQIELVRPASQLYKIHFLKTRLKNCLTPDLTHDIEASMPTDLINKKYGHIFFIKIVSHTFSDKEAHQCIMYEYILKLKITESNNMEGFQK
jgi:hypothetical protein